MTPLKQSSRHLVASGFAVGLTSLTGLEFDPTCDYTCCLICGVVFQSNLERNPSYYLSASNKLFTIADVGMYAQSIRREWSKNHAKLHTEHEHNQLKLSGRWATPEAACKLAAYGIFSASDAVLDNEVSAALLESKPVPKEDANSW